MSTSPHEASGAAGTRLRPVARIAVGIDGHPEGRDAAVLGAKVARTVGAELMLVAVHPDPLVVLPKELDWAGAHAQAEALLRETRDELAPEARIDVETDWSVPRALERVVMRERRDLLVVGSSREGPEGRVRIGTRTRQLLYDGKCAVAVAPRGYGGSTEHPLRVIAAGYDGGAEAQRALALAGAIAAAAGARLLVRGVVDDRLPTAGWTQSGREHVMIMWRQVLEPEVVALRADAEQAVEASGAEAELEVLTGAPADVLGELSAQVDLIVIGSRRWGTVERVFLGSVGERLMHDASCPILVVPRSQA